MQEATALRRWCLGCTWASWPGGPSSSLRCGLCSLYVTLQLLLDTLLQKLSDVPPDQGSAFVDSYRMCPASGL